MKGKRILLLSLLFVLTVVFTVPVFAKAKIKLNRKTITIAPKQTVKLTVKVKGEKKKAKWKKAKWKNIKWSSSNKKIATVSKTGEVKGRKAGKVVIKAKVKGKTLKCKVTVTAASSKRKDSGSAPNVQSDGKTTFTFIQKGWYVARLEVEVWDKQKQNFAWRYSDSCAIGQTKKLSIDTSRYEINRVGYQIWFFGWDNDYMNLPWANTDYALTFTLSGSGDYPEFTW